MRCVQRSNADIPAIEIDEVIAGTSAMWIRSSWSKSICPEEVPEKEAWGRLS
jgi:hypothetical protein